MNRRPADAGRARRLDALDAAARALGAVVRSDPALAERTGAMLAGSLPAPDLENAPMRPELQTSMRLPADLVERADALIPALTADPDIGAAGRVTRSTVIRVALARGLAELERAAVTRRP